MIVMIQYIQDLISWKSVCPHHFPTLGHIFSLLHHYECCVHCLSPKQLALFLCREGCGSYMHQAHSSSCSLSSLVKPHNFCGLFTLAVDKGGLSYAIRYPRQLWVYVFVYKGMLLINIEYKFQARVLWFLFCCIWGRKTTWFNKPQYIKLLFPSILYLKKSIRGCMWFII